ncbi:MAG: methyl-accepting chemotaxis protein [Opitutaceae bacterium]|nr:methyl-accepting chemotaxis protein [Opitutaceae bacterium]
MNAFLNHLAATCEEAAAGNLEARVSTQGCNPEEVRLANAINLLLDVSDAYVRESSAAMETCARGEYHRPIIERGLKGSYRLAAGTINRAVLKMRTDAERIEAFQNERAAVAAEISTSTEQLNQSINAMWKMAEDSRETSAAVATSAAETSNNIGAVAAACQELTSTTAEISNQARSSTTLVREVVQNSQNAHTVVKDLGEAARQISSITSVITKIARQTNLLALNATIEAARAGEHGRGFAVVAGEVKTLARETAAATEKIGHQLDRIQSTSSSVAQAIGRISDSIQKVDAASTVIASSVAEQVTATEEIAKHVSDVSRNTSEISSRIGNLAKGTEGLASITGNLKKSADALAGQTRMLTQSGA